MISAVITGIGHYVPENIVTNQDLEKKIETNNDWIVERTGIEERRHIIPETETTATLAAKAAEIALKNANLTAKDIDFIVFATLSPDYYFPGSGVVLQEILGCDTIGAMDIRNQCSGFIYALDTADSFIKAGKYKNILVVGAEIHSFGLDMTTRGRGVSVIFGDGAGAVILSASDDNSRGIISSNLHSEGKYAEELAVLFAGTKYGWLDKILDYDTEPDYEKVYPYMNGNFVFKHAVTRFPEAIMEALQQAGEKIENVKLLIPHQANLRISQFVQKQLGLSDDKVYNNIQKYGNTTAASIPIALSEAYNMGKIEKGDLVCLVAFGSGFTWGAILLKW